MLRYARLWHDNERQAMSSNDAKIKQGFKQGSQYYYGILIINTRIGY